MPAAAPIVLSRWRGRRLRTRLCGADVPSTSLRAGSARGHFSKRKVRGQECPRHIRYHCYVRRIPALLIVLSNLTVPLVRGQAPDKAPSGRSQGAQTGPLENGVYRNSRFGFQYKVPFGWVERTEQMRDSPDPDKSLLLLAVFERPPEAQGETVNSAVVITAESTSAYSGLKTAADYFVPLSDIATGKGFTISNEPYYFNVGSKKVVRGDFSKKVGDITMNQSSLVVLEKGYFVSFTFLGGGEDEVNELIEKLTFSGTSTKRPQPAN